MAVARGSNGPGLAREERIFQMGYLRGLTHGAIAGAVLGLLYAPESGVSALSWSSCPVSARRRMSRASSSSSSRVVLASPRRASAARTWSGEARSNLRSITGLLRRDARLETAIAAVLIYQDSEVDATRRRVDRHDHQLRVCEHRDTEEAAGGARPHDHDGPAIHHQPLVEHVAAGRGHFDRVERDARLLQPRGLSQPDGPGREQ